MAIAKHAYYLILSCIAAIKPKKKDIPPIILLLYLDKSASFTSRMKDLCQKWKV